MFDRFIRPARFAAVAALPLVLAASVPVADGTTYEFVAKSMVGDKETVLMRGRGTVAGENARIDILDAGYASGSGAFGSKGSYFLVLDAGKKMLLVDPSQKAYMAWDMSHMFAGMSKAMNAVGGLVKMEMSDIRIDAHDMGAGETIHGYATRHVRMTQNYTMNVKVLGRSSKSRNESTTDFYFAPALKHVANPFVSNSQAMAMTSQLDMFNNPDFKNQMAAANAKMHHGIPIRTVSKSVSTDDKGKQQVSVMTSEMLNFAKSNVPASTFAIPAGYQLIEMPGIGAALAGAGGAGATAGANADVNADSIAAAAKDGAKDAAKEAAKAAAKEAGKAKLRGIFKR